MTDTPYNLTDEDKALLESVPEEARPAMAARLARDYEGVPRRPQPDRNQGAVPKRAGTLREAAAEAFALHFQNFR